jgi:hypothetical protein
MEEESKCKIDLFRKERKRLKPCGVLDVHSAYAHKDQWKVW